MRSHLPLIRQLALQDLLDRHAGSQLGAAWVIIKPLSQVLIFTLIFSSIMGVRLETLGMQPMGVYGYSIYLVIGILAWLAFAQTIMRCAAVYKDRGALISKVRLPLGVFPLYIPVSEAVTYLIGMAFFVVFLVLIGFSWSGAWLWWPVLFVIMMASAYGIGMIVAVMAAFVSDLREIANILLQMGFWLTPIVYVKDLVPGGWHWLFAINPMHHMIDALRQCMMAGQPPGLLTLLALTAFAASTLVVAAWLVVAFERDIRDVV